MSEPTDDFEYERRFFCRELPAEYDDGDAPTLIIQSYYVHADNYALRVRLVSRKVHVDTCKAGAGVGNGKAGDAGSLGSWKNRPVWRER